MFAKILLLVTVLVIVEARLSQPLYHGSYNNEANQQEVQYEENEHAPIKYNYKYGVEDHKTGDFKTHHEERDGDVVKGEYSVAEADGSIRTVTYTVDKHSGFQAKVTKSGGKASAEVNQEDQQHDQRQEHQQAHYQEAKYENHNYEAAKYVAPKYRYNTPKYTTTQNTPNYQQYNQQENYEHVYEYPTQQQESHDQYESVPPQHDY